MSFGPQTAWYSSYVLAPCLLFALTACGGDTPAAEVGPVSSVTSAAAAAAAETITPEDIYRRISILAADSMRGRDTPSPELDQVAEWIAAEFAEMGLVPGAGDSFIQRYALRRYAVAGGSSASFSDGASLEWGSDLVAEGVPEAGTVEGPVVLVSGGAVEATSWDGLPSGAQVFVFAGPSMEATRLTDWAGRTEALFAAGAGAVTLVSTLDDERWARVASRAGAGNRVVGDLDPERTVTFSVRESALAPVLAAAGVDVAALQGRHSEGVALQVVDGLTLSTDIQIDMLQDDSAPNVVGILEGRDPVLKNEYVVYSAHMDHVGVRANAEGGDSIFNGADDDASGTATIIEVAEAMAALEEGPRRSMVFLLVSGEEKGLLGSQFYAENPTVPLEAMVANLNADMVGRNWPDTIVAIGKEHSDLGETMNRVNEAHPEIGMTAIDDVWPDERFYFRSDHYNFARKGVPILFFFNGTHDDYHRASDEVDKIDTEKTARIGRLLFYLGLEVSDADARPQWNPESYEEIVEVSSR
jgi:hypothetical protein